jgi:hypothetical protein
VSLGCGIADDELVTDLGVRPAGDQEVKDLPLAGVSRADAIGGAVCAVDGWRTNSSITDRVTEGARSASPFAMIRTAAADARPLLCRGVRGRHPALSWTVLALGDGALTHFGFVASMLFLLWTVIAGVVLSARGTHGAPAGPTHQPTPRSPERRVLCCIGGALLRVIGCKIPQTHDDKRQVGPDHRNMGRLG